MKQTNKFKILAAVFLCLNSCSNDSKQQSATNTKEVSSSKLFERLYSDKTGINFVNIFNESETENSLTFEYFTNGAGVATGDINNDGLQDIFFSANQSSCKLYLNKGNLRFEDITKQAGVETDGWCTGVTMADVNADGFLDIYVCRSGKFKKPKERENLLFINQQNNTFKEMAHEFGLDNNGYSTQAIFFDADNDNDLDMFLVNHGIDFDFLVRNFQIDNAKINSFKTQRFYLNVNNSYFKDYSKEAGVLSNAFGLNAAIADINNDGYADIYVSNDYHMPDFLYINNGKAVFTESIDKYMKHMPLFSMGSDFADFNNDGLMDLMTLDMLPEEKPREKMLFKTMNYDMYNLYLTRGYRHQRMQNCLQLNNGNGTFSDIAMLSGVYRTDWSWSALFADFNNDGGKDLFVSNGTYRDLTDIDFTVYRMEVMRKKSGVQKKNLALLKQIPFKRIPNYMYENNGDLTFTNQTTLWGLNDAASSNGAAYSDLDNDGDLEIIINNLADSAMVYENKCNKITHFNYLKIKLNGPSGNSDGVGAIVTVYAGNVQQLQQMIPSRGYMSACDNRLNFGLKENKMADWLEVKWVDGKTQRLEKVKTNQMLTLDYKNAIKVFPVSTKNEKNLYFDKPDAEHQINFVHSENPFIDFKREPLLPHEFSKGGPFICTGDVNGDQHEDFFIGNAKGSSGKMFIQKSDGSFIENKSQPWEKDKMQEDMGCLLFDSDGDKDLDLYVVSGGAEEYALNDYYQDRLYINDGRGNFKKCIDCLPEITSSGSCVIASDYDDDGDLDLFRGGRIGPSFYPMPVNSYLLQNKQGHFTDVIATVAPGLQYAGLVKDAVWCDFNKDTKVDLVICGEWMPIMMFQNNGRNFEWINKTQNGAITSGWWNKIVADDFDRDGDIDFVAGNYGLNSKFNASPEKPLEIVAKDFDNSGTLDAIICNYEVDGKSYPIYSRDDLTDQIRPLRKQYLRYADYANKTIDQIFPADSLKAASVFRAYTLASCYLENTGNGNLNIHPLPMQAQFAPVNGIVSNDFNKDGHKDLLIAGNSMAENVALGFCDAGTGLLLLGDGKGNFIPVSVLKSGFIASKDVRDLDLITLANNKKLVLVANNNSATDAFRVK